IQLLGRHSAYVLKASNSSSKTMIQLCEWVPLTGIPRSLPARRLEVESHPPIKADLLAVREPSIPWARRSPNSMTVSTFAARQTRAALVAIRLEKLIRFRRGLSKI